MNEIKFTKIVVFLVILSITFWHSQAQSQSVKGAPEVGRDNPFADIYNTRNFNLQNMLQPSQPSQAPPELIAQSLPLKFLNAKSTSIAFTCMLTEFGNITVIDKSNSLLVVDTKENLEKIINEIKKIDKSVPGLAIEAMTLKFLDAKNAKEGLEMLCSENGTITIVEKSNSLIICDTQKNIETIRTELHRIDKLMPGLIVETITLKYIDAKSAQEALTKMSSEYGSISIIERTNSLVICDTKQNLDMILAEVEKIDRPTSGLFVETVTLKFLDAKNLKSVLDKMVSQYGNVSTNEKTNSLIICDTRENLDRILKEVKKADKTPQQIMVEVIILDVQLKDDTEIGINWDMLTTKRDNINYRQNFTTSRMRSTIEDVSTLGDATAFNTVGLGGDFSVIIGSVRNVVHMIQQKRDVEILASPRAMMVSGQTAQIQAVEQIPYTEVMDTAEGGAAALTSTQFKDVGVTLQVTATLIGENDIFLTVEAEQSVKTSVSERGVPIVDSRKANTSLLLKDGQIVVMGGLRREEKTKEVYQIPIIGDFPIVGNLFKSTNTVMNNSELIVLISPHVFKGEQIPKEVMVKYRNLKEIPIMSPQWRKKKRENQLK